MAAENYWRYADARQQQQAMVAAAAGMAPAASVAAAQSVAGAAAMPQQAAAMAQQAAAPPLKRARPDFGDVSTGQDMTGYYPRETDRAGYHSLRENEAIGASYDRYLRNGMSSVGANDVSRAVVGGMAGAMGGGMAGYPVDDRRMMGVGMDGRGMGYGARPEPPLPPDASNTLYIEGLPANCTRREVSHIFRPFVGFREVRLVNKESRHPGGDPHVLCFVDFDNPAQATIALEALQGYKFDEHDRESAHLRLQFSRFPGPRSAGGPRGRR
ncbi:RNA-binding protein 1-like [Phragmites australis]|uniref:RNA-binding protein 1-like n=1 Tax=Phragmites australis TaxID=29695 RepID=UPI002D79F43A|nr:RNA-binding protein 1-like [Phragmites australis]